MFNLILENVHDPQSAMSLEFFMISTFFMYLLVMGIGYFTRSKYFYFAGALLWFVPIFNYQNIFVITTSVIVFISHLLLIFYTDKDDVFE